MLENKNNVHQEVEDLTVGTIKRSRTVSSGSSSSSELGSFPGEFRHAKDVLENLFQVFPLFRPSYVTVYVTRRCSAIVLSIYLWNWSS